MYVFIRCWIGIVMIAGLQFAVWAQPKIHVDRKLHDFGTVYPEQTLNRDFKITNVGDQPLEIAIERTTCGCTAAILSATRFLPGSSGIVSVTTTTRSAPGKREESAILTTNDPENPMVPLTVFMNVKRFWKWSPDSIFHFPVAGIPIGTTEAVTLYLNNEENKPFRVTASRVTETGITVEAGEYNPARGVPVTVTIDAGDQKRDIADVLYLQTDFDLSPRLQTTIRAKVVGLLHFNRDRLFFSGVKKGEQKSMELVVRLPKNIPPDQFQFTEITSDPAKVTGEVKAVRPNGEIVVNLTFQSDDNNRFHQGTVTFKTNLPEEPVVTLPYSALMRM